MSETAEPSSSRILIFGGTFDPPHLAHARLPALAAQQLDCVEILYVPAAINPLKGRTKPTAKEHRLAMLWLAIADVPNARITTVELDRNGPSYTIDTLRVLHGQSENEHVSSRLRTARLAKPQACFYLLIGADQALDFHRWKDWQEILTLATPAVMLRPPWDSESFERELRTNYSDVEAECWLSWTLRLPQMDISATEIRKRLHQGAKVDGLLDPAVADYIRTNGLYKKSSA